MKTQGFYEDFTKIRQILRKFVKSLVN